MHIWFFKMILIVITMLESYVQTFVKVSQSFRSEFHTALPLNQQGIKCQLMHHWVQTEILKQPAKISSSTTLSLPMKEINMDWQGRAWGITENVTIKGQWKHFKSTDWDILAKWPNNHDLSRISFLIYSFLNQAGPFSTIEKTGCGEELDETLDDVIAFIGSVTALKIEMT